MVFATMWVVSTLVDIGTASYVVIVSGYVTGGSSNAGIPAQNIPVPFSTNRNKRDELVREGFAAAILSLQGLVIDPDDIYVPFS